MTGLLKILVLGMLGVLSMSTSDNHHNYLIKTKDGKEFLIETKDAIGGGGNGEYDVRGEDRYHRYIEGGKPSLYGSGKKPNKYGSRRKASKYGSGRKSSNYGSGRKHSIYGRRRDPNKYGSRRKPSNYVSGRKPGKYGRGKETRKYGEQRKPGSLQPTSTFSANSGSDGKPQKPGMSRDHAIKMTHYSFLGSRHSNPTST